MAENKKSFILYCDVIDIFSELNDTQAGKLIKHILDYVNDKNPSLNDPLIKMAFTPIKQQLKRDLIKYRNMCKRNRVNGSKGGRPRKPKKPTGYSGNPEKPKKAVTDTVTDTDIKKESTNVDLSTAIKTKERDNGFENLIREYETTVGVKLRVLDEREKKYQKRREKFTHKEILTAMRNILKDSFLQGDNESKKVYGDIDYILRNDKTIEKYFNPLTPKKCKKPMLTLQSEELPKVNWQK